MGQVLFKLLGGAIAGLLAWVLIEPTRPAVIGGLDWGVFESHLIFALGALIGFALGGLDGLQRGGKLNVVRGLCLGALFGLIGCALGYSVGGSLGRAVFGDVSAGSGSNPAVVIPWRILSLTPIGIFLGAGIGASSLTGRKILQGAIGGAIGAGIGAALFDAVGTVIGAASLMTQGVEPGKVGEVGSLPRAIFCVLMGGLIGVFIGIVERMARSAWVRLTLGRNEGKEWPIDAAQTFIGRSEGAQIPLFGDPAIAPMHACITRQGDQYYVADGGAPGGTLLNGHPVQQAPLNSGDHIRVGSFDLEFLLKAGRAPARAPEAYPGQAYPIGGQGYAPAPGYGMPPQAMPHQPAPQQPVHQATAQWPANQPVGQPTMAYPTPMQPGPMQATQQGRGWTLAAMDGPLAGQRFPILGPVEVGRECPSIPMAFDTQASRRHASFSPGSAGIVVTDLASTNGVFVNGQRVSSSTIGPGDLVKIGGTTFRVES